MVDMTKIESPAKASVVVSKINELIDYKQEILVSGTNIKTINNESILGSGNITISSDTDVEAYTAAEVQTIWNGVS